MPSLLEVAVGVGLGYLAFRGFSGKTLGIPGLGTVNLSTGLVIPRLRPDAQLLTDDQIISQLQLNQVAIFRAGPEIRQSFPSVTGDFDCPNSFVDWPPRRCQKAVEGFGHDA